MIILTINRGAKKPEILKLEKLKKTRNFRLFLHVKY